MNIQPQSRVFWKNILIIWCACINSIAWHYNSESVNSATTTTQTQLASHARSIVDRISPEKDVSLVTTHFPRSLASAIPKPILYQNHNVGECNDLIFGFSLVDYATARGLGEGDIPKIVRICIQEVDQRGLDAEGIYRVSSLIYFCSSIFENHMQDIWSACCCTRCKSVCLMQISGSLIKRYAVTTQDRTE